MLEQAKAETPPLLLCSAFWLSLNLRLPQICCPTKSPLIMPSLDTRRRRREAADQRDENDRNNIESGYGQRSNNNPSNEQYQFKAGSRITTESASNNYTFRLAFFSTFLLFTLFMLWRSFK
jgi:hypothetical protein